MAYLEKKEVATLDREESKSYLWYLDSGCSNQMCGNKTIFSDFDKTFKKTVKLELKSNLISMGQLQEKGYTIIIQKGCCKIIQKGCCKIQHPEKGLIAEVHMTANRMDNIQNCLSTKVQESTWLWHYRYGHLNFFGLRTFHHKQMVIVLPMITPPSKVREDCVVSKRHRDEFPKGKAWRAHNLVELMHSNICGPITPEKLEAFNVFKSFKSLVENEIGRTIKTLRTDRGGENCPKEFEDFLC
ncbi:unnamed protein product [Prunus armeniaca]